MEGRTAQDDEGKVLLVDVELSRPLLLRFRRCSSTSFLLRYDTQPSRCSFRRHRLRRQSSAPDVPSGASSSVLPLTLSPTALPLPTHLFALHPLRSSSSSSPLPCTVLVQTKEVDFRDPARLLTASLRCAPRSASQPFILPPPAPPSVSPTLPTKSLLGVRSGLALSICFVSPT